MRTHSKELQETITPQEAVEVLREGNRRFLDNLKVNRDLLEQVNSTAEGQYPFAVVLSCIDSRTSAELIFDQGLGDIFSIRIAGNVLNKDILGSMEFACAMAGSKLIVVLGHSGCGAVQGACAGAEMGHLTHLLEKIKPAVEVAARAEEMSPKELVDHAAACNVERVVREVRERSEILDALIGEGTVGIVGAMYSVSSGTVDFHDVICGGDC